MFATVQLPGASPDSVKPTNHGRAFENLMFSDWFLLEIKLEEGEEGEEEIVACRPQANFNVAVVLNVLV